MAPRTKAKINLCTVYYSFLCCLCLFMVIVFKSDRLDYYFFVNFVAAFVSNLSEPAKSDALMWAIAVNTVIIRSSKFAPLNDN